MKWLKAIMFTVIIFLLSICNIVAQEKLGLVIIAHGAPIPQWNKPVLDLEKEVKSIISEKDDDPFTAIRVAFMEFNKPSINTVIKDFERIGIDKVFALPLLIAPSEHSIFDIPTILGLYNDKDVLNEIRKEGTDIVNTNIRITVGPTLKDSDVLKEAMLDRVNELSISPNTEGVVLLGHGDEHFEPIWASMCREIGNYICAKTGIEYFDYAFIEIGQSFASEGVTTIKRAIKKKQAIIVIGLYLSMGVENIANTSTSFIMDKKIETKELFADKNVRFANRGILPDKRISEWIVNTALEWLGESQ